MNHKRKIIRITCVFLFITAISIFFCCAPQDPADIAGKIAQEWASNNVNDVSRSMAGLIANNNPLVETAIAMAIGKEINQRIAWEYSQPQKLAEDQYRVVATAYTEVELPLLGNYKISVDYNLEIDTKNKKVISADIDASSFAMRKL